MPAPKSKKAMPTKKVVAKPAAKPATKASKPAPKKAPVRAAAPARPRPARKSEDIWTKQYFGKEQDEFYAKHPNSKVLIALFTGALILFLYIVWTNKLDLFPQAFIW
jgi:hypothetical protein